MIDSETGLHYNRFRYYAPDLGMFISRDPIGLLGGNNVFAYTPNPVMWIDPWGLEKKPKPCSSSKMSPKKAKELQEDLRQGRDVTVKTFKDADKVLYGAFNKTRKVRGAGDKSPFKTTRQKKDFKLRKNERGNTAIFHKDYQFSKDGSGTLVGHEGLPAGHGHMTIPHINVLTPQGKKATIYIER